MSAFIVGKEHIDVLITAAVRQRHGGLSYYYPGPSGQLALYRVDYTNADEVGAMLLAENIKSVWARYPNEERDTLPGPIPTPEPEAYIHRDKILPAVAVLKALACYEYQSCETGDEWRASRAHAFCDALRHAMIAMLPGYEDAAWEVCA